MSAVPSLLSACDDWIQRADELAVQAERDREALRTSAQATRATREALAKKALAVAVQETLSKIDAAKHSVQSLIGALDRRATADWTDSSWHGFAPSDAFVGPRLLRIGSYGLPLPLQSAPDNQCKLPSMVPLFGGTNLFFVGQGPNLLKLNALIQGLLLRVLATVAPGQVRMTLIDAATCGQNFSHLLALNEQVRGRAVWHQANKITEALAEITDQMSMVIQKRLTNKYRDLEDYNSKSKLREPYHIVTISDFPAGFRDREIEGLIRIAQVGSRAGIHIVATFDTNRATTRGSEDELLQHGIVLQCGREGVLRFADSPLSKGEVLPDLLPEPALIERIIVTVNAGAKAAQHVELEFERPAALWQERTTKGISAVLGRGEGEVVLRFGEGTTHHALLGGSTGSGKSILLHTLILSACSSYSPEELLLYLIDFKQGVEFASYRDLPHVRVLAVQSEREFGLSVLQGIEREIEARGQRFIAAGAQDLASYRERTGEKCPRILLIIDEFQVFFEYPDSLSSEALRLFDVIARKGRSFGVHQILATQSLPSGGLMSGTISQFGVRIALRMSEAESRSLLADDNKAAARLDRPGEAIFNDHGGQVGSNIHFQVSFLSPEERATHLRTMQQAAEPMKLPRPLVFDGTKPSSVLLNNELVQAAGSRPKDRRRAIPLYLGEPSQVQDSHAAFRLRRQSRANLLLCGQDEETALAICASVCASLILQLPIAGARMTILDLSNTDSEVNGDLKVLSKLAPPGHATYGERRQVAATMADLRSELERRARAADVSAPEYQPASPSVPWLLCIFGLQGAREFQRGGEPNFPKGTAELDILRRLLFEGPDLGIHVLAWINNFGRLQSTLERSWLNEFEVKVALRGGEGERVLPVGLHGSAVRSHFGFLSNQEDPNRIEKFRVYGDIIQWLTQQAERSST